MKISIKNYDTTHNNPNGVSQPDILSDHFTSFANAEAIFRNAQEATMAIALGKNPNRSVGFINNGVITPAENQATATLVKNSEYTLGSPLNSVINNYSITNKISDVKRLNTL